MEDKMKGGASQNQPTEKQALGQKQPAENQTSKVQNKPVQNQQAPAGSQPKSSNSVLIIIIIILVGLVVLSVGGYFGWKYVKSYISKKTASVSTTNTATSNQTPTSTSTTTPTTPPSDSSATTGSASKTTVTSPKGGEMPINGYVIADSNSRIISESEITSLTPWQLKAARNEIYARHGREFVHQDLSCYFATQNWYAVDPNYSETLLSYTENKNVATILNYEEKIASSYLRVDSGC